MFGYGLGLINLKSMVMGMGAFEGHMRKECVAALTSMNALLCDKRRLAFVGSPRVEREQLQELRHLYCYRCVLLCGVMDRIACFADCETTRFVLYGSIFCKEW